MLITRMKNKGLRYSLSTLHYFKIFSYQYKNDLYFNSNPTMKEAGMQKQFYFELILYFTSTPKYFFTQFFIEQKCLQLFSMKQCHWTPRGFLRKTEKGIKLNMEVMCTGKNEIKQLFCYLALITIILLYIVPLFLKSNQELHLFEGFHKFLLVIVICNSLNSCQCLSSVSLLDPYMNVILGPCWE